MTLEKIIETRRFLHQHPEASFVEYKTAEFICRFLDELKVDYERIETSVIARIDTGRAGRHLGFRADIDALYIQELNDLAYGSENQGLMHACGHDAHTTILLYTIKEMKDKTHLYQGKFTFIFQQAEEIPPGGALTLIKAGILEGIDEIYGLHCDPEYDLGDVMTKAGPLMAAVDKFKVRIIGKGGHGALPHTTIDPIVLTSQIIVNLQSVISRSVNPLDAALMSIGMVHGGESFNVIPESVTFEGTVRTLSEDVRRLTERRIRQTLDGMTQGYGASYDLEWTKGYPVLINHVTSVEKIKAAVESVLGVGHCIYKKEARLLGEDFASYLEVVPGAFFFLGTRSSDATAYPLHSPRFNIDEKALAIGVKIFLTLAKGKG